MFDPASFFGHSEFELAIMDMFGGFRGEFWDAYHAKVRRDPGGGNKARGSGSGFTWESLR